MPKKNPSSRYARFEQDPQISTPPPRLPYLSHILDSLKCTMRGPLPKPSSLLIVQLPPPPRRHRHAVLDRVDAVADAGQNDEEDDDDDRDDDVALHHGGDAAALGSRRYCGRWMRGGRGERIGSGGFRGGIRRWGVGGRVGIPRCWRL